MTLHRPGHVCPQPRGNGSGPLSECLVLKLPNGRPNIIFTALHGLHHSRGRGSSCDTVLTPPFFDRLAEQYSLSFGPDSNVQQSVKQVESWLTWPAAFNPGLPGRCVSARQRSVAHNQSEGMMQIVTPWKQSKPKTAGNFLVQ
ncbi:hypothetical protein RRG08_012040 [Elysia crispata]|uniref:Uncharacterized protein n=1 Tax=Elysia crispata TaxID=231223 RepID=A0AAE0XVB3_9GAST|nr:hypothetical protein RRG08_012040 [Elysia crispata]